MSELSKRQLENRVRQASLPAPSAALRGRVLSIAVASQQPLTWSDRMWFSRTWRLAAVGAVLALVVLDQFSGAPRSAAFTAAPQVLAEAQAIDEAGRQVGLPPGVVASLGRRIMSDASRPRVQHPTASELLTELTGEGGGD